MPRQGGERRRTTIVEEAIRAFGREGYQGASLEVIASAVGVRKQTLLYYFPTKDALLETCLGAAGERVAEEIAQALGGAERPWDRAEAVIHSVYELAAEWPEFPMFIREAGRLGPHAFDRFAGALDPLRRRAIDFLQAGMDAGLVRKQDPALLDKPAPSAAEHQMEGAANRQPATAPAAFTRDQIAKMSLSEFIAQEEAINEALRNKRIR